MPLGLAVKAELYFCSARASQRMALSGWKIREEREGGGVKEGTGKEKRGEERREGGDERRGEEKRGEYLTGSDGI